MFSLDYDILIKQFTPSALLYKSKFYCVLKSLIAPVKQLYQDLLIYKAICDEKLNYTPQTIYIEKLLNDKFDNVNREIYIEDLSNEEYHILYNKSEGIVDEIVIFNKSENEDETELFNKSEIITINYNVRVPATLYADLTADIDFMNSFRYYVEYYKMAGKRYQILSI